MLRQGLADTHHGRETHFQSAEPLRLQHLDQPGLVDVCNDFIGELAVFLSLVCL